MRALFSITLIILVCSFLGSCKKSHSSIDSTAIDTNYLLTATISDSGVTRVTTFSSDTCLATDTTYGSTRMLQIIASNFDSNYAMKEIILQIYNYSSLGNYTIKNDTPNSVTVLFEQEVPASTGPTLIYFTATSGVITISYLSTQRVQGSFNVNNGTYNYTGNFNAKINN